MFKEHSESQARSWSRAINAGVGPGTAVPSPARPARGPPRRAVRGPGAADAGLDLTFAGTWNTPAAASLPLIKNNRFSPFR